MSRGRRTGMLIGGIVIAVTAVGVLFFGFVGVSKTVTTGTQTSLCGTKIGVSASSEPGQKQTVRLLGVSDESLSAGDRVRVNPVCVIRVVSIGEKTGTNDETDTENDQDGGGTNVILRWRLW
ncbi:MAG: hypothetical protein ACTIJ6_05610 [Leucobacter sp.]